MSSFNHFHYHQQQHFQQQLFAHQQRNGGVWINLNAPAPYMHQHQHHHPDYHHPPTHFAPQTQSYGPEFEVNYRHMPPSPPRSRSASPTFVSTSTSFSPPSAASTHFATPLPRATTFPGVHLARQHSSTLSSSSTLGSKISRVSTDPTEYKLHDPLPISAEAKLEALGFSDIRELGTATGLWRVFEGKKIVGMEWQGHRLGVEDRGVQDPEAILAAEHANRIIAEKLQHGGSSLPVAPSSSAVVVASSVAGLGYSELDTVKPVELVEVKEEKVSMCWNCGVEGVRLAPEGMPTFPHLHLDLSHLLRDIPRVAHSPHLPSTLAALDLDGVNNPSIRALAASDYPCRLCKVPTIVSSPRAHPTKVTRPSPSSLDDRKFVFASIGRKDVAPEVPHERRVVDHSFPVGRVGGGQGYMVGGTYGHWVR